MKRAKDNVLVAIKDIMVIKKTRLRAMDNVSQVGTPTIILNQCLHTGIQAKQWMVLHASLGMGISLLVK